MAAEYGPVNGDPFMPPSDDQLTMEPPRPAATMALMACFVPSSTPRRSTSISRSYCSMVTSAIMAASAMPATLHTTSSAPNVSDALAIIASTSASWVTSQCTGCTASPSSFAVSSSAPLTSAATTLAPSRTNTCTDALPIPEPAPVTTATLPSNSNPISPPSVYERSVARRRRTAPAVPWRRSGRRGACR